jgi:hypothetical protein
LLPHQQTVGEPDTADVDSGRTEVRHVSPPTVRELVKGVAERDQRWFLAVILPAESFLLSDFLAIGGSR